MYRSLLLVSMLLLPLTTGCKTPNGGGSADPSRTGSSDQKADDEEVAVAAEDAPDSMLPEPERLPAHFSPEQIRSAMPKGTVISLASTTVEGSKLQHWTVTEFGDEQLSIEYKTTTMDGTPAGDPAVMGHTWAELSAHASFEKARTTIEKAVSCETALGKFECTLYTVDNSDEGQELIQSFYFSDVLPGPPLIMSLKVNGEEARRFEQVARSPMPGAASGD